jgi:Rieske Fe-S protein
MSRFPCKIYCSILIAVIILATTNSCKDDYNSVVPYAYVDMSVNPTNYIEFNIPGGSVYFPNAGFGGIIVFHDLVDSSNPFLAFDAACTYELSSTARVTAKDDSGVATCPVCGSQFILFGGNGSPIKGPAAEPLKQYRTSFSGGRIMIRN